MPRRRVTKAHLQGAGWGKWGKKLWGKVKTGYNTHVKKHVKKAAAHAKKVAREAASAAKRVAAEHARQMLEEAKQQAKEALMETVHSAAEAATHHVRKTVCGAVGSGFHNPEKKKMIALVHRHFDLFHKKAVAHAKRGGRGRGAGIEEHAEKAKQRFEKGVDNIKNSAKSKVRALAGCDEDEGEGFNMKGAGMRMRGAGAGRRVKRINRKIGRLQKKKGRVSVGKGFGLPASFVKRMSPAVRKSYMASRAARYAPTKQKRGRGTQVLKGGAFDFADWKRRVKRDNNGKFPANMFGKRRAGFNPIKFMRDAKKPGTAAYRQTHVLKGGCLKCKGY
jgi:hypothetical protein